MGAIRALWLRQIKRQWRSKPRMIGSLAQPLLFLVAFGFGFGSIFERAGGGNYIQFLSPGIIAMTILFGAMFTGIEIIWDRKFGFLKETLVAPVSRFSILIGRTLGGATVAFAQGFAVFLICFLFGFRIHSLLFLPLALLLMFCISFLFTALGTAIATPLEDMQAFPLIMNFLIMPMFFLSGALFPVESMPRALQMITVVNPLTYGVNGLRTLLTAVPGIGVTFDILIVTIVAGIITLIGTYLFSRMQA